MKIKVRRCDGRIETIELFDPLQTFPGKLLNHIRSGDGTDHYFTPEGDYDGWGMNIEPANLTDEQAASLIQAVESQRKIEES